MENMSCISMALCLYLLFGFFPTLGILFDFLIFIDNSLKPHPPSQQKKKSELLL